MIRTIVGSWVSSRAHQFRFLSCLHLLEVVQRSQEEFSALGLGFDHVPCIQSTSQAPATISQNEFVLPVAAGEHEENKNDYPISCYSLCSMQLSEIDPAPRPHP